MNDIYNLNRYETMQYNRCGKSGLKLPAIALGLWQNFGEESSYSTAVDMVKTAFNCGITHFDLANNYGPPAGSAEETFGRILKANFLKHRDEMIISSKAGYHMWPGPYGEWGSRKNLIASLDQSLKRCGVDYFDIFYHHRPDPDTPLEETMGALAHSVNQGKALYVGVSNYSKEDTEKAHLILKDMGIKCLVHQPKYSMFERSVEDGLLDTLDKCGMGAVAFSPLAQGLLTDKYLHGIPEASRAASSSISLNAAAITPDKVAKALKLNAIAQSRGQSLAQMALAWVLRKPQITSVIIGARNSAQIMENVETLDNLVFTQAQLDQIDSILNSI
ncbi:L-glyceraldehyde 3-phosphate reductase [Gammaproteobacteria bacterium]|nr:L-glyceraldehyde 3-phosphate reductase [Gammaproteobacteria bacterium]